MVLTFDFPYTFPSFPFTIFICSGSQRMPVGYALSLFQLSMIVTVFFGYHFFKEQDIGKKLIGTLIMIAGSVMIILLA